MRSASPPVGPSLRGWALPARHPGTNAPTWPLGRAVAQARQARGLTQSEIADLLQADESSIQDYESGRALPRSDRLAQLARSVGWDQRSIGTAVRAAREGRHETVRSLARRTGIDRKSIERLEAGQTEVPHPTTLARLAAALGEPVEVLAFGARARIDPAELRAEAVTLDGIGAFADALRVLDAAVVRAVNPRERAKLLIDAAQAAINLGQHDDANERLSAAYDLIAPEPKDEDAAIAAWADVKRGWLAVFEGEPNAALAVLGRAQRVLRDVDASEYGEAWHFIGRAIADTATRTELLPLLTGRRTGPTPNRIADELAEAALSGFERNRRYQPAPEWDGANPYNEHFEAITRHWIGDHPGSRRLRGEVVRRWAADQPRPLASLGEVWIMEALLLIADREEEAALPFVAAAHEEMTRVGWRKGVADVLAIEGAMRWRGGTRALSRQGARHLADQMISALALWPYPGTLTARVATEVLRADLRHAMNDSERQSYLGGLADRIATQDGGFKVLHSVANGSDLPTDAGFLDRLGEIIR